MPGSISRFRRQFRIDSKADLRDVVVAVDSVYEAFDIASTYLDAIDSGQDIDLGFRLNTLINLLGRVFEQVQGMLVALATGSPASAEALGRIVVEGSVNLMYLASQGNSSTLISFFREWLEEHRKRLTSWKTELHGSEREVWVLSMIDERAGLVDDFAAYVDGLEEHLGLEGAANVKPWPRSILARFQALGRQADYYTSYHRLSGASHITAEDTISWLFSLEIPEEKRHQVGIEAWAYSTMMTRIAATFFVDAAGACVTAVGRTNNDDLHECWNALFQATEAISEKAGVPKGKGAP